MASVVLQGQLFDTTDLGTSMRLWNDIIVVFQKMWGPLQPSMVLKMMWLKN